MMSDNVRIQTGKCVRIMVVAVFVAVMVALSPHGALAADPILRQSLVSFFDRIAAASYNSVYFTVTSVEFSEGTGEPDEQDRVGRWFVDQVKDSVVQSKKVSFHVLDPYETIGHDTAVLYGENTIQYSLKVRVKNIPAGWRFDIEFIDTTTMLLIDRDSMIVPFALVDAETKPTSPASTWTETFDALATRTLWASGTNETGFANMENWVVENGALRQLKTRTAYEDPHTRQYTTGYSSLLLRSGYTTQLLAKNSILTVSAEVEIGPRDSWLEKVGVISYGFSYEAIGGTSTTRSGTFWLQNAFSKQGHSDQNDARKILGIAMDGKSISTYEGNAFFEGYSSPLTRSEITKCQPGKRIVFRIVLDIGAGSLSGDILFNGDARFTKVGSYATAAIKGLAGNRLIIRPIVGCVGTVCAFDSITIDLK